MSLGLWNLLHDGDISEITAPRQDTRLLRINISYLRDMFEPPGTAFHIQLLECDTFVYQPYDSELWLDDPTVITGCEPEILSATIDVHKIITITCTNGLVRTRYARFELALDSGAVISLAVLDEAAIRYWQQWDAARSVDKS